MPKNPERDVELQTQKVLQSSDDEYQIALKFFHKEMIPVWETFFTAMDEARAESELVLKNTGLKHKAFQAFHKKKEKAEKVLHKAMWKINDEAIGKLNA